MKSDRDQLFLHDIHQCCAKIAAYIDGVSEPQFKINGMLQDAVVRNIEIIGEAAKALSETNRSENPQIAWREIIRMRDKVVHHYFRIDLDVVWQTFVRDIAQLRHDIQKLYDTGARRLSALWGSCAPLVRSS